MVGRYVKQMTTCGKVFKTDVFVWKNGAICVEPFIHCPGSLISRSIDVTHIFHHSTVHWVMMIHVLLLLFTISASNLKLWHLYESDNLRTWHCMPPTYWTTQLLGQSCQTSVCHVLESISVEGFNSWSFHSGYVMFCPYVYFLWISVDKLNQNTFSERLSWTPNFGGSGGMFVRTCKFMVCNCLDVILEFSSILCFGSVTVWIIKLFLRLTSEHLPYSVSVTTVTEEVLYAQNNVWQIKCSCIHVVSICLGNS